MSRVRFKYGIFNGFRKIMGTLGVDAFPQRPSYHYVPDYYGRAAGKQIDIRALPVFGDLASGAIKRGKTLLYYDRLYMIYQSLLNLKRLPNASPMNMAEVGVYRGGTSHFIASVAEALGFKAALHCFDTFEGHAAEDISSEADSGHGAGLFNDTTFVAVKEYLKEFDNVEVHKGRFQNNCSRVEALKFHFVHLDVDLYEPTLFALNFFNERLVKGGALILDDYGVSSCPGVKRAVDDFLSAEQNYFSLHPLTEQYILVKD